MHEENFKVRYHEMGPDGTAPVWVLQNYFQEAAGIDAHNLAYGWEELSVKGVAWIMTKLQIKVMAKVHAAQNVKVRTWHCFSDKIQSRRDFVMLADDGSEIAKGVSWWLILDLAKRKIMRSPVELVAMNDKNPAPVMEASALKNPRIECEPVFTRTIIARLEDLDTNNHVNNAHFSAWAIAGTPEDFRLAHTLDEILINFRAEVKRGDTISVNTYADGPSAFWHILVREEDGKEIASVHTDWNAK